MLSNMEQRIRECYDAFLEAVTEDRDLWEIALLEYYRWPLEYWRAEPEEDWEQPVPVCFEDLAPELPRLVKRKEKVHPNDDCATVQLNLEWDYGWESWNTDTAKQQYCRKLPDAAVALLLEYYLLVEAHGDEPGDWSCHILFKEEPDTAVLERIVGHGVRTPEEQMTLAIGLRELCGRWQLEDELEEEVTAWLLDLIENLLSDALWRGCGEASWHLYELLWEQERFGDSWAPLDLLREAAEAGCADAQCEIVRLFCLNAMGQLDTYTAQYYGDGFSAEEAVRWLEQVLPYKIEAALYLARLFLEGKGVPADEALAVRVLTAAVEGRREETGVFFDRSMCFQMLAECYAEGRGAAKDRRKAAKLYRQARYSGCFLFDYYKDGADVPRDPRAAVRYWMRDMCYQYHLELWNVILSLVSSLEGGSPHPHPEQLRLLFGEIWQNVENSFYTLLGKPVEWPMGRVDDRYGLLRGLLEQERVRLLYDGARGDDSRCGDILTELLTSGVVTREALEQLSPNSSGVYDWPDAWYEETLERIEGQLTREVESGPITGTEHNI